MGVREHYKGESDGLSDPSVLLALIRVVYPDYADLTETTKPTFKTATSKYKACQANGGTYIPLDDATIVNAFDIAIRSSYSDVLQRMHSFADMLIDRSQGLKKDLSLVRALVDLICCDDSIPLTQHFYINEDGSSVSKAEIGDLKSIAIQPFLLGTLHFVVKERPDNTIGQETYNMWFPPNGNKSRIYNSTIGTTVANPTEVIWCEIAEEIDSSTYEEYTAKTIEPPISETKVQTVTNPFVFNQYGSNGIQIGSVENLVLGSTHKEVTIRCKLVNQITNAVYLVPTGALLIGRNNRKCRVCPNDHTVSMLHACITFHNNGVVTIKDLNAINGTFVNGSILLPETEYTLRNGDTIQIGQTTFNVVIEEVML